MRQCLDQTRFTSTRRTSQQKPQLVRISLDTVLSRLGLELIHDCQQVPTLLTEETLKGLVISKLVSTKVWNASVSTATVFQVEEKAVGVFHTLKLVHIPIVSNLEKFVNGFFGVGLDSNRDVSNLAVSSITTTILLVLTPALAQSVFHEERNRCVGKGSNVQPLLGHWALDHAEGFEQGRRGHFGTTSVIVVVVFIFGVEQRQVHFCLAELWFAVSMHIKLNSLD
mmetsp:Transcript_31496/g.76010  ORF Transcript_31496/g.76010 Transcript_31496/m.76010 type:complete len:225 (-) Transcript_31496:1357-2031(-)